MKSLVLGIKAAVFILLFFAVYLGLGRLFNTNIGGARTGDSLYHIPQNSVDVVFMGSSHSYCTFVPQYLFDQAGITSIHVSTANQRLESTYWLTHELFSRQKPEYIILDLFSAAFPYTYHGETVLEEANYNFSGIQIMPDLSVNKFMNFAEIYDPAYNWTQYFHFPSYHNQYKELDRSVFDYALGRTLPIVSKGFMPLFSDLDPEKVRLSMREFTQEELAEVSLPAGSREYLYKIIELTKKHGTQLVFAVAPYYTNSAEEKIFKEADEMANQFNIPLINFNAPALLSEMRFSYPDHLSDIGHVNFSGAIKVSQYITEWLLEQGSFTDKRQLPGFEAWSKFQGNYLAWETASRLSRQTDFKVYVNMLRKLNNDYFVLLITKGNMDGVLSPENQRELEKLGISGWEEGDVGYGAVWENGRVVKELRSAEAFDLLHYTQGYSIKLEVNQELEGGKSIAKINNNDFSLSGNGLSFIVYSKLEHRFIDRVRFNANQKPDGFR